MVNIFCFFALFILCFNSGTFAQTSSSGKIGLQLGAARNSYAPKSGRWSIAPALTAQYYFQPLKTALCAEIQLSHRYVGGPGYTFPESHNLSYITFPLYIKLLPADTRVHPLVGGFYATCLDNPKPYSQTGNHWEFRRHDSGACLGMEMNLLKTRPALITAVAMGFWSFSPMFVEVSTRGHDREFNSQLSFSLVAYPRFRLSR